MYHKMKRWFQTSIVALGLFVFGVTATQAATVSDPSIGSVTLGAVSSTLKNATAVNYNLTVVFTQELAAGAGLSIQTWPTSCMTNYDNCVLNFQAPASISGLNGTVTSTGYGNMFFSNTDIIPVGSYTITINNGINPNFDGALRFALSVPSNNTTGNVVATVSDVFVIGSPLAQGKITHPTTGVGLALGGQVANTDWSLNQFFNADEWGNYAVTNPGFSSGASVNLSVYPESSSGLSTTTTTFTYTGTTATVNLAPTPATKTITGTVVYVDTNAPVTTATVNANGRGNGWANATLSETGSYTMTLAGGDYNVCLGDRFDDSGVKVSRDWYLPGERQCQPVSFIQDTSTEVQTVNFTVHRADAKIIGVFKNPNGTFPADGWASFSTEGLWFSSNLNRDSGVFEVPLVGGKSYQGQFQSNNSTERTYWSADSVAVNPNQTLDLGTIILKERDVVYTATVKDSTGVPVSHIFVDAWQERGGWTHAETDQNGVATLYLYEGSWNIRPSTWNTTNYIYTGKEEHVTLTAGSNSSGIFMLQATTLTVTARTAAADGTTVSVNGWANCWKRGDNFGFGGEVRNGTGTFGAVGGDFECNLWVNDENYQATGQSRVTFVDGVNTTLSFTMLKRTATVTVYVKDQNGKLINASNGRVSAHSTNNGMVDKHLDNGQTVLRLAPGDYHLGVWFEGDNTKYISTQGPNNGADVQVEDNDTISKTLTVFSVSGTIDATVVDSDKKPVANAWVHCGNWSEQTGVIKADSKESKIIESGAPVDANGKATIGLVTGHRYECNVGARSESSDLVGSEAQMVDLTSAKKASAAFIMRKANAKITGKISLADDAGVLANDLNDVWCHAWSNEGYNSFGNGSSTQYTLNAITGTWNVSCSSETKLDNGKREWYSSSDTVVKVTGDGTVTKDLILSKSVFQIPESFSETFDATQAKIITLSDGTQLNIPAYALATEGNITFTAEPELQAVETYTDGLANIPWNFEVYDSTGTLISGDFSDTITLVIPYNQAALKTLDIDEATILPKYFDTDSNSWKNVDNATLDDVVDQVTLTLSHFSQVGLVYNQRLTQTSSKNIPSKLKAKRVAAVSALLTWKKPQRKVSRYVVQLRELNAEAKESWKIYTVQKSKQLVQKLLPDSRYQFRVKACTKKKCFKFSDWTKFKTKRAGTV